MPTQTHFNQPSQQTQKSQKIPLEAVSSHILYHIRAPDAKPCLSIEYNCSHYFSPTPFSHFRFWWGNAIFMLYQHWCFWLNSSKISSVSNFPWYWHLNMCLCLHSRLIHYTESFPSEGRLIQSLLQEKLGRAKFCIMANTFWYLPMLHFCWKFFIDSPCPELNTRHGAVSCKMLK